MANRTATLQPTRLSIERLGAAHPHLAGCSLVDLTHDSVVVLALNGRTYRAPITLEGGQARITGAPSEVQASWVPLQAVRPAPKAPHLPPSPP